MASPLHDNPKSPKSSEKKDDKKPEEKKPESGGDEKAAIEKKASEKPKEADGEKPAAEGEGAASPKDEFMDGMKNIQKRHESERRDFHGNAREQMRQMGSRHNKEIADHFDLKFGKGETPAAAGPDAGNAAEPAAEE